MQLDATRLRDEAGQSGLYLLLMCLNPLVSGPVKIGTVTHLTFFGNVRRNIRKQILESVQHSTFDILLVYYLRIK